MHAYISYGQSHGHACYCPRSFFFCWIDLSSPIIVLLLQYKWAHLHFWKLVSDIPQYMNNQWLLLYTFTQVYILAHHNRSYHGCFYVKLLGVWCLCLATIGLLDWCNIIILCSSAHFQHGVNGIWKDTIRGQNIFSSCRHLHSLFSNLRVISNFCCCCSCVVVRNMKGNFIYLYLYWSGSLKSQRPKLLQTSCIVTSFVHAHIVKLRITE